MFTYDLPCFRRWSGCLGRKAMSSATSERGLLEVPLRAPLSAQYKTTFAYPTIKDRCPVILCKVNTISVECTFYEYLHE
jgi:hypothetical protein